MSGFFTCLSIISTLVVVHTAPEQYHERAGNLNHNEAPAVVGRIPPCAHQKDANMFSLIQAQSEGRIVNNQQNKNTNYALETAASNSYPQAVTVNSQIAVGGQNQFNHQVLPLLQPIPDFNRPPQYNQNSGSSYNIAQSQSHQHQSSQNNQNSGYHYGANHNLNQFSVGQSNAGYAYPVPQQQNLHGINNNFNIAQNKFQHVGSFSQHNQQNQQFLGTHNIAGNAFDGQLNQIIQETVSQTSLDPTAAKHIYVHVPPEDLEEKSHQRVQAIETQPRKHYKIIFIKAPTYSQNAAQLVAAAPPSEEKTLIYVLVKKPEEPSFEELQQIQETTVKHHKPEVYFIKYKTRKEGEGVDLGTYGQSQEILSGNFGGNNDIDVRSNSGESSDISISNSYTSSSVSDSLINGGNEIIKPHELYGVPLQ